MLSKIVRAFIVLLPWQLKRWLLQQFFGYKIHPSARIGLSWFYPENLIMHEHSVIGHGNVAIHLEKVEMGVAATIGRGNWITGYPKKGSKHFTHQHDREPVLLIGDHAAITKNHHLDCTHAIRIGSFTTIAGYNSQFLTHSIDIIAGRQHSEPIEIGDYCFVGTDCTVLGGGTLPERSVLGAKSLLNNSWNDAGHLYGGIPAKPIKVLPEEAAYFHRKEGFVA